jgi:hypothetical protein
MTRTLALSVLMLLLGASLAQAASTTGSVTMVSGAGDWVGAGASEVFDAPGTLSLGGGLGGVAVQTPGPNGGTFGYTLTFAPPSGQQLHVGEYNNSQRWPFEPAGSPGLDVSGDGRGCNDSYGRFVVLDIHADPSGDVDRFWALYEQHCEGPYAPPLFGEVRVGEPASTNEETVEPAAIDWPSTAPGASGTDVPVTVEAGPQGARITSVEIDGDNEDDFVIDSDGCSGVTLAAGANCTIQVAVDPTVDGDLDASLVLSDRLGAVTTVPLAMNVQPFVASVSPCAGLPGGGTVVTISGEDFDDVTGVQFGSQPAASFTVDSPSKITATSPPGTVATAADVTVTNDHGVSGSYTGDRFTYADPPAAPTGAAAVGGTRQALVSFTESTTDGGSPVTGYTVTASPGGAHVTGQHSPITVPGLSDGTTYTFSVKATNLVGTSPASVSSRATTLKPTTTTIESAAGSFYGTPLQLNANVGSTFSGTPTGTVVFSAGGHSLGPAPLGAGGVTSGGPSAVIDVGESLAASYPGDSAFEPSSGTVQSTVRPAVTAASVASSANPAPAGSNVILTATVANKSTGVVPFGTVQFTVNGSSALGPQVLGNGKATITVQLASGSYRIGAQYHDGTGVTPDFVDSLATLAQTIGSTTYVGPTTTTTTTTPSVPDAAFVVGQPVESSGGTIVVAAQTADPGIFTYAARVVGHEGQFSYGRGWHASNGRTPATLIIRPSARARSALARHHTLHLRVVITFRSGLGGTPHSSVVSLTVRNGAVSHARRR